MKTLPSGRVPFSWTLPPDMKKRFYVICEREGYQKQAQVQKAIGDWILREERLTGRSSKPQKLGVVEEVDVQSSESLARLNEREHGEQGGRKLGHGRHGQR